MAGTNLPQTSNIPLKHARVLRGPSQVAFDITNRCNFRCLHCFNRSGENPVVGDELSDEEIIFFIEDVATMKPMNLCFCGGEPLLRLDVMCKAAEILKAHNIMVSMVTNGSLVTKEKARRLIDSGVGRTQVSLDGARPETHERLRGYKGAFERATNAIRYFREVGYTDISVAFCPTSFNWYEVEAAFQLVKSLGVTEFRVQPLMLLGTAQQTMAKIMPTPLQYRHIVRTINRLQGNNGIRLEWGDPIDHLIRMPTLCEHCVNFSNVKANGGIDVSPYLPLTVGNIRRHKLSEYWDAGLARIWEVPKIKEMASRIASIQDMGRHDADTPTVWYEKDIELDLIDDLLLN